MIIKFISKLIPAQKEPEGKFCYCIDGSEIPVSAHKFHNPVNVGDIVSINAAFSDYWFCARVLRIHHAEHESTLLIKNIEQELAEAANAENHH